MLQKNAACRVHDTFRHAGRARGEQYIKRMIERQALKADGADGVTGGRRLECHRIADRRRRLIGLAQQRHDYRQRRAGELGRDVAHLLGRRDCLAIIVVAVAGYEKLRLDLSETIERALHAEIGRAGRPDRPERGDGQHCGHRLRHVGQHRRHPVADTDPMRNKELLEPRYGRAQLLPAQAALDLVLAPEDDGGVLVRARQQILGEIEPGIGEKPRAGHLVAVEKEGGAAFIPNDFAEIPKRRPEHFGHADRKCVKVPHIRHIRTVIMGEMAHETVDIARCNGVFCRNP